MMPLNQPQGLKLETPPASVLGRILSPGPRVTSSYRPLIMPSICNTVSQKHSPLFQALFLDWTFVLTRDLLEGEGKRAKSVWTTFRTQDPETNSCHSFFQRGTASLQGASGREIKA